MRLRTDLVSFPLDDDLIVFSIESQRLIGLNASAALVFGELQSGTSAADLPRVLASKEIAAPDEAARWVTATLDALRSHGMLADGPAPPAQATGSLDERVDHAADMPPLAPFEVAVERRYRLLETCALIRFGFHSQKRLVDSVIGHLAIDEPRVSTVVFDIPGVFRGNEGINSSLYCDGQPVGRAPQLTHLGPQVKAALWSAAVDAHDFRFYVHAGVVGTAQGCVILPAAAGSGKSSVTAALVHRGFRYYSDEVALIDPNTFHVPPVPLAICVKSTGWDIMARYFPDLLSSPPHRRGDGKLVRYVAPPAGAAQWPPVPVSHIVFPRYEAGVRTELKPVARSEALRRLMAECLALRQRLDHHNVQQLVHWISHVECAALTFSSLDEAVELIAQAVPPPP
jgi:hypothetical protein